MTFETKYNFGDEVWCMDHNEAFHGKIIQIEISQQQMEDGRMMKPLIRYTIGKWGGIYWSAVEPNCYDTKEELLKSL